MSGRLDPLVVVGEAGVGAHGANDRIAGDVNRCGAFEDVVEDAAKIAPARGEQAGGMSMPVERAKRQVVIVSHAGGLVPVDEHVLDRFAFRMMAHEAFALVAFERRLRFRRARDEALRCANGANTRRFPAATARRAFRGHGRGRRGNFERFFVEKDDGAIERGEIGGERWAGAQRDCGRLADGGGLVRGPRGVVEVGWVGRHLSLHFSNSNYRSRLAGWRGGNTVLKDN